MSIRQNIGYLVFSIGHMGKSLGQSPNSDAHIKVCLYSSECLKTILNLGLEFIETWTICSMYLEFAWHSITVYVWSMIYIYRERESERE